MAKNRVSIELPQQFQFCTETKVKISDLNYGKHLGHDSLITILHNARADMLDTKGMVEGDIDGLATILRDLTIQYSGEAFFKDQLAIKIAVTDISRATFKMFYLVTNQDNNEIAKAELSFSFFDLSKRKPARTPQIFIDAFGA